MTATPSLLRVADLRVTAPAGTILDGVSLEVRAGETIGIVGESGSGKSVTARALLGLVPHGLESSGSVELGGKNLLALRERELRTIRGRRISLLLQDPFTMLNPLLRAGTHVAETARRAGGRPLKGRLRRADTARRLAEVGIADPAVAARYPFQLSGGMRQRVGIAAALASDPEILIADEPTTALDVTTQEEILRLLRTIQQARAMALVLITHDLRIAFSLCDSIYVLYAGSVLETGPGRALEREPLHPYTLGLLTAEPPLDRRLPRLTAIDGSVPAPDHVKAACSFAARCAWSVRACHQLKPDLLPVAEGRMSACLRLAEIRPELEEARAALQASSRIAVTRGAARPVLTVEQLRKSFAGRRGSVLALDGVSLEVGAGECVGLVGESGSGKTTLARCVLGLETPDAGQIEIDGIDASSYAALDPASRRSVRSTVQMVFQDPYSTLNPARRIGSTLSEALELGAPAAGPNGVVELLARVGLPADFARRKPRGLSGGERQRVAIARALAVRPKLIVCDEPVSALDVSVQAQILNLVADLRRQTGISFLFITHDLAVVRQVAERVYVLHRGSLVETGPADEVLDRPRHPYTRRLLASVPRADADWLDSTTTSTREPASADSGTHT